MKSMAIYHANCSDGAAAAACFYKYMGDELEYIPAHHNTAPPDVRGRVVYLLDFSYPKDIIEEMLKYARMIIVIDHHENAVNAIMEINSPSLRVFFDKDKSGAVLAWEWLQKYTGENSSTPRFLLHVQDRDLWKLELPGTREIMESAFIDGVTIENFVKLIDRDDAQLDQMHRQGSVLLKKIKRDVDLIIKLGLRRCMIGDWDVPLVNAPPMFASDIGHTISENEPFAATYFDTRSSRLFSLRSRPDGHDVSEVARRFGGNGHKHAAGFKVSRRHDLGKV